MPTPARPVLWLAGRQELRVPLRCLNPRTDRKRRAFSSVPREQTDAVQSAREAVARLGEHVEEERATCARGSLVLETETQQLHALVLLVAAAADARAALVRVSRRKECAQQVADDAQVRQLKCAHEPAQLVHLFPARLSPVSLASVRLCRLHQPPEVRRVGVQQCVVGRRGPCQPRAGNDLGVGAKARSRTVQHGVRVCVGRRGR